MCPHTPTRALTRNSMPLHTHMPSHTSRSQTLPHTRALPVPPLHAPSHSRTRSPALLGTLPLTHSHTPLTHSPHTHTHHTLLPPPPLHTRALSRSLSPTAGNKAAGSARGGTRTRAHAGSHSLTLIHTYTRSHSHNAAAAPTRRAASAQVRSFFFLLSFMFASH